MSRMGNPSCGSFQLPTRRILLKSGAAKRRILRMAWL
jgi:hypothetical protein